MLHSSNRSLYLSLNCLPYSFNHNADYSLVLDVKYDENLQQCLSSLLFPVATPVTFEVPVKRSMSFYFLISHIYLGYLLSCCFLSIFSSCLSIHSFKIPLERVFIVSSQRFFTQFFLLPNFGLTKFLPYMGKNVYFFAINTVYLH